jgi:glycosyltransferase involved in cell wall biosynthesis
MSELTIIMPTYNSISRNGDGYLQQAIEALLNQTHKDFRLHILDNMSSDNTFNICEQYAMNDSRIDLSMDVQKRFPEGSINELAKNVDTEYIMLANCDDLWNHHYIEILLPYLKKENIECVYSNGNFIDMQNHIGVSLIKEPQTVCYTNDINKNFCIASEYRSVIPVLFGIFKTEAYKKTLPFKAFDNLKANVDNLFLLKFILNGYKAKLINKDLFYYRSRPRTFDPKPIKDMPRSPVLVWVYYANHYLKFYNEVIKHTDDLLLKTVLFDSVLRTIPTTIRFIVRDMNLDKIEFEIITTIYNRYAYINELLLKNIYPELTQELLINTHKKGRVLRNHIFKYIEEVMMPHKLIEETVENLERINLEFKKELSNDKLDI